MKNVYPTKIVNNYFKDKLVWPEMIDIEWLIKDGYISCRQNPQFPNLSILNYTAKTQYESYWNNYTLQCRGLIVDDNWNIIARPFPKIFNYEEIIEDLENPDKGFSKLLSPDRVFISNKIDGSLGIMYKVGNRIYIATRGSFNSEQALIVNDFLIQLNWLNNPEVNQLLDFLDENTILVEIVYPENRIVIDYQGERSLYLLDTMPIKFKTRTELEAYNDLINCGVILTKINKLTLNFKDSFEFKNNNSSIKAYFPGRAQIPIEQMKNYILERTQNNTGTLNLEEGVVIRFNDFFRIKVKYEEYVRLHKLKYNLTNRVIWTNILNREKLNLEQVPDEQYKEIKEHTEALQSDYDSILAFCQGIVETQKLKEMVRKDAAHFILNNYKAYSSVLFTLLDDGDPHKLICDIIRPSEIKQICTSFKNTNREIENE